MLSFEGKRIDVGATKPKLRRFEIRAFCDKMRSFCTISASTFLEIYMYIIVKLGPGYTFDFGFHTALFHTGEPALISVMPFPLGRGGRGGLNPKFFQGHYRELHFCNFKITKLVYIS